ncbi:hypothetical protein I4U23_004131 [Adineta vaga]|nr:hypothetical protein I4U23_004131 [Adineta vaga]
MDRHLTNVILLGLAFMILFTAFQATGMVVQSVLEGFKNETSDGRDFQGSGYISLAIVYAFGAVANIFAPVVVSILGLTLSMFIGATTYFVYVISFLSPRVWSFYLVSILLGIGAAILWTAEGAYLAFHSNELTAGRNAGIFWALFQASLLPGSLYMYLSIDTEIITRSTRYPLFAVFSIISVVGLVVFVLLIWRRLIERRRQANSLLSSNSDEKTTINDIIQTLKIAFRLMKTRNMLLLLIPFAYTGFSQTFFQTVYSTCIGHYIKYGAIRKRLIGLHGVVMGIGEILGGGLFGIITKPKTPSQRSLIILIGCILQLIFYYSVFVNYPFDAPAKETDRQPYFDLTSSNSQLITFIGSFIVGFVTYILASRYKATSASAFAIFQLVQGVASAIAYMYASSLGLQYQLLIIVIAVISSTFAFFDILFKDSDIDLDTSVQATDYPMKNMFPFGKNDRDLSLGVCGFAPISRQMNGKYIAIDRNRQQHPISSRFGLSSHNCKCRGRKTGLDGSLGFDSISRNTVGAYMNDEKEMGAIEQAIGGGGSRSSSRSRSIRTNFYRTGQTCTGDNCPQKETTTTEYITISSICALFFLGFYYISKQGKPKYSNEVYIQLPSTEIEYQNVNQFESGFWISQYYQYSSWHGPYQCSLKFDSEMSKVIGNGSDDIGQYTIEGIYSTKTNRMGLIKTYRKGTGDLRQNLGHNVIIQLSWNSSQHQFEGKWFVKTNKYSGQDKFEMKLKKNDQAIE